MAKSPFKDSGNQASFNLNQLLGSDLFQAKGLDVDPIEAQQPFQVPGRFGQLIQDSPAISGGSIGFAPDDGTAAPSQLSDIPTFNITPSTTQAPVSKPLTDPETIVPNFFNILDAGIDLNKLGLTDDEMSQIEEFLASGILPTQETITPEQPQIQQPQVQPQLLPHLLPHLQPQVQPQPTMPIAPSIPKSFPSKSVNTPTVQPVNQPLQSLPHLQPVNQPLPHLQPASQPLPAFKPKNLNETQVPITKGSFTQGLVAPPGLPVSPPGFGAPRRSIGLEQLIGPPGPRRFG